MFLYNNKTLKLDQNKKPPSLKKKFLAENGSKVLGFFLLFFLPSLYKLKVQIIYPLKLSAAVAVTSYILQVTFFYIMSSIQTYKTYTCTVIYAVSESTEMIDNKCREKQAEYRVA